MMPLNIDYENILHNRNLDEILTARRRRSTKQWSHKVKFNKKNKRKRVNKIAKLSRRKNRDIV